MPDDLHRGGQQGGWQLQLLLFLGGKIVACRDPSQRIGDVSEEMGRRRVIRDVQKFSGQGELEAIKGLGRGRG